MKKSIHLLAISATAIASVLSGPALAFTTGTATVTDPVAVGANGTTLAAMATVCSNLAASLDPTPGVPQSDLYRGVVVAGSATSVGTPTEVGPRTKSNIVGKGVYTPAAAYIKGDPFRVGGSVNMFGDQWSTSGSWSDSEYDFTSAFNSTFAYGFSCQIQVSVYHEAVVHPPVPVQGYYLNWNFGHGNGNDNGTTVEGPASEFPQGACAAYNSTGNTLPFWGENKEQCKFIVTAPAQEGYTDPEFWDPYVDAGSPIAQTPINQDQQDTLSGHETSGGPVQAIGGDYHVGQVVICISPTTGAQAKKGNPGTWVAKNGYETVSPTKCTTEWFKVAPWGAGTDSSNGTYISVPNYSY
ncbi:hypothetical protein [Tsuneonella sp. HG222]